MIINILNTEKLLCVKVLTQQFVYNTVLYLTSQCRNNSTTNHCFHNSSDNVRVHAHAHMFNQCKEKA